MRTEDGVVALAPPAIVLAFRPLRCPCSVVCRLSSACRVAIDATWSPVAPVELERGDHEGEFVDLLRGQFVELDVLRKR
jgi:hypothetical protein